MADSAMLFVPHAVERCPGEARLHLAHAIVSEQQWLRGTAGRDEEAEILDRYEAGHQVSRNRRRSADAGGVVSVAGPASSIRRWRSSTRPRRQTTDPLRALSDRSRSRTDPPRAEPTRRRGESLSRGADDLAGRAVGTCGVDDAAAEPWRSTGSRDARRSRGDRADRTSSIRGGRTGSATTGSIRPSWRSCGRSRNDRPAHSVARGPWRDAAASRNRRAPLLKQEPAATFRPAPTSSASKRPSAATSGRSPGLKITDFELLDNGVAQEISDLNYERLPIDVTVVLDVSASVTGAVLDQLRQSVRQLKADLGAARPFETGRVQHAGPAARRLRRAGRRQPTPRSPRCRDTAAAQFSTASPSRSRRRPPRGRRHLIVLFSDGQDSSSITDPDVLFDVARRTTATVDIVLASADRRSTCGVAVRAFSWPAADHDRPPLRSARPRNRRHGRPDVDRRESGVNVPARPRRLPIQLRAVFTPKGVDRTGRTHSTCG